MAGDSGASATTGARTERGRRTRSRILRAALELVSERGYEGASMRAIADRAGVSVGNAYYYFPSKAHLLQGFYAGMRDELAEVIRPILARERTLEGRLRGTLWAWFRLIDPRHEMAGALFIAAADPRSPVNPFGPESATTRGAWLELYREVVEGSSSHVPDDLREELPGLLWAAHMGVTLFWVQDTSPRRERTQLLIDRAPGLLVRVMALSRLPGVGDLRRRAVELVRDLAG